MTVNAISSAVSALTAYGTKLNATAHNIANLETKGYKSIDAVIEENPSGNGVKVTLSRKASPWNTGGSEDNLSTVDLAEALTDAIQASQGFKASVKTIQTMDNMAEALMKMMDQAQ